MKAYGAAEVQYHAFLTSAVCVISNDIQAPFTLPPKEVQFQWQSVGSTDHTTLGVQSDVTAGNVRPFRQS